MSNTLPAPTEGLVYTNPTTGKRMKFSDGCWKSIDYLPLDGSDSMQGTLWTPDQLINGNTLTADSASADDDDIDLEWIGYPSANESNPWRSVVYGNGMWVAVAGGGTNRLMYSIDAINWTQVETPNERCGWKSVTYGGSKFVAVGSSGTNRVMYSEDGINWTGVPASDDYGQWMSVTYGDGKFVAVGLSGDYRAMYSEDGITWTSATTPSSNKLQWNSVTYGNGKFVAVARYLPPSGYINKIMYSTNGVNWTALGGFDEHEWTSVTYGDGKFVAVSAMGQSGSRVMSSVDGISWTKISVAHHDWECITYGNGFFVAVASSGNFRVMYAKSEDVATNRWDYMNASSQNDWLSVTYGDGKFVSVSSWTGVNKVMILDASEGSAAQDLYFNGDPVVIDTGLQGSLATLLSTQSRKLGRTKYYQDSALPTGDSYDYPDGSLWYQPTSNNLHFYNDSDQTWVQL